MKLFLDERTYIDTASFFDLSIAISHKQGARAWYVDHPQFTPVRNSSYIGSVREGGSVNFRDILFNPHGHGTHTECLGHITREVHSVNSVVSEYFFRARLISILPKRKMLNNGEVDFVITPDQIGAFDLSCEALIIRTFPNEKGKMKKNYSSTNPPYVDSACVKLLNDAGIDHLLIDLPSVDRESDDGKLLFHHAFWGVPDAPNFSRTITELIFIDNSIKDGDYLLNLQMASFENDATPSRPILYPLNAKKESI